MYTNLPEQIIDFLTELFYFNVIVSSDQFFQQMMLILMFHYFGFQRRAEISAQPTALFGNAMLNFSIDQSHGWRSVGNSLDVLEGKTA